jgi:NADP-dependent 3-hydroxy acid dehydrogenase YdfG
MSPFQKQIAVVTGSSGGIGGAIAAALVAGGAHVNAVGRDSAKLESLVARLRGPVGEVEAVLADLTKDEDVALLHDRVTRRFGRLDILVHSAGAIAHGKLEESPIETMDALYAANVRGPCLLTKGLLPLLKSPRGQIVFINSSAGLSSRPNAGIYSATQHAVKALADGLRNEVNADNVRVLSIYPGRTATPLIAALTATEGSTYRPEMLLQPSDIASVVSNALALPWTAEVTDINIRSMQKSY